MYSLFAYLKFLKKSKNHHGVHSPFIYDFVTKCLYDKTNHTNYKFIKAYRKVLIRNKRRNQITDYGSGSKVSKSNNRSVKEITTHSGTPLKKAKLLYRIVNYFSPEYLLELGTSLGIATQAMGLNSSVKQLVSIEGCPNINQFTKDSLSSFSNIELINDQFKNYIPKLTQPNFDLIYFDGHHEKEATINYFHALLPKVKNDSIFIFDDIYWSKGMEEAWHYIKEHKSVSVTVDIFHFGIVFFRKEQAKEHFQIRL